VFVSPTIIIAKQTGRFFQVEDSSRDGVFFHAGAWEVQQKFRTRSRAIKLLAVR
jgi:hypothetical protein